MVWIAPCCSVGALRNHTSLSAATPARRSRPGGTHGGAPTRGRGRRPAARRVCRPAPRCGGRGRRESTPTDPSRIREPTGRPRQPSTGRRRRVRSSASSRRRGWTPAPCRPASGWSLPVSVVASPPARSRSAPVRPRSPRTRPACPSGVTSSRPRPRSATGRTPPAGRNPHQRGGSCQGCRWPAHPHGDVPGSGGDRDEPAEGQQHPHQPVEGDPACTVTWPHSRSTMRIASYAVMSSTVPPAFWALSP